MSLPFRHMVALSLDKIIIASIRSLDSYLIVLNFFLTLRFIDSFNMCLRVHEREIFVQRVIFRASQFVVFVREYFFFFFFFWSRYRTPLEFDQWSPRARLRRTVSNAYRSRTVTTDTNYCVTLSFCHMWCVPPSHLPFPYYYFLSLSHTHTLSISYRVITGIYLTHRTSDR